MPITDNFFAINIRKYLALGDDPEAGEPALIKLLSEFSCPNNLDVKRFLKKSAIDFTKKNQSVTYLVFSKQDGEMLGYFTLALKPLTNCYRSTVTTVFQSLIPDRQHQAQTSRMSLCSFYVCFSRQGFIPTIQNNRTANVQLYNSNLKVYGKH